MHFLQSFTIALFCVTVIDGSPILEKLFKKKSGPQVVFLTRPVTLQKLPPPQIRVGEPIAGTPIRSVQIQERIPMVRKVTITQQVPVQKTILVVSLSWILAQKVILIKFIFVCLILKEKTSLKFGATYNGQGICFIR